MIVLNKLRQTFLSSQIFDADRFIFDQLEIGIFRFFLGFFLNLRPKINQMSFFKF